MSQPVADDTKVLTPKTADDIFTELNKDDTEDTLDLTKPIKEKEVKLDSKEVEIEDKEEDKKDEEEVDELALLEEELEDIPDEKLELTTPVRRREILSKYPNLFKDFPYLEKAYYREQQFTEILSTIDDAKTAAESHKILQAFSDDMVEKGNVKNVLKMIKERNPETFNRVADNYMEHLREIDESAYIHVQSNTVKNIILGMVEEAKSSNDDDLRTAALLLNKWAFGSSKFTPPQKMAKDAKPEDKTKENEISKREEEFNKRQLDSAVDEVNHKVNNTIKAAIEGNIDPNKTMTDYVRKHATQDAVGKITRLIENDKRFQVIIDKLWEKAERSSYSRDSQDEIRKAFLSKAKSLLAPVLKSARNEALKGMGKRVKDEDDVVDDDSKPQRQRVKDEEEPERRLSSDKSKAKLDALRGKTSYEALNALMGD